VAFAECFFEFDIKGEDGSTKREHLKVAANATKKVPVELQDQPELPESASHVWDWFLDLNAGRTASMAGLNTISYLEIKAWADLHNEKLAVWEVKAIKALDNAFLSRKDKNG
jgi:hypothetical protein